ncbi:MAG: GMC family oxidoreductase [Ornithinibacter sp.]
MVPTATAEHVDAVVVGSGFGGSVAAYRLAEAGRSVVVLERGRAYPPGSFPRTPGGMAKNFWEPRAGRHGLYDVWGFEGIDGLVSSGLGGGSLIYANVLLRKDEKWFVHEQPVPGGGYEHWPVTRADLEPHYDAVEEMIGTTTYPYLDTPKTAAMREAAKGAGMTLTLPPLAISFSRRKGEPPVRLGEIETPDYGNIHGLPRVTCRLCGECDLGCNDGAKNTLDHTYLSAAQHHGADIRTRHEVRGFRPLEGGGYEVVYVIHTGRDGEPAVDLPTHTVRCDRLVLAAGTFGTSLLLLRNRSALPGLSAALGRRFSGNGDLLGFVLGAASEGSGRDLDANLGPVITSAIRVADEVDEDGAQGRGHYVQDAGYPAFGAWLAETAKGVGTLARAAAFALDRVIDDALDGGDSTLGADLATMLGDGALTSCSLPLLGMGRDVPDGVLRLDARGRLAVDWTTETSAEYFSGVHRSMRAIAAELGGTYHDNPLWWARRVITVHPIGGAVMGRNPAEGVCDAWGEVFGHPGLHVLDGALLPGPVGPNPSLTIAAVADRCCTHILESAPGAPAPAVLDHGPAPEVAAASVGEADPVPAGANGLRFTERMRGFAALGVDDPQTGFDLGKRSRDRLMFELTISVDDVDQFVANPHHEGSASGWVESDLLGGRLEVERGWFNLFVEADDPDQRRMLYRLWITGAGGNPMTFSGFKEVRDEAGVDLWRDTSTLFVSIRDGHLPPGVDEGRVVASGVITIHVPDFLKQLTTFRTWGKDPVAALDGFGSLFLGQLWEVYGRMVPRTTGETS